VLSLSLSLSLASFSSLSFFSLSLFAFSLSLFASSLSLCILSLSDLLQSNEAIMISSRLRSAPHCLFILIVASAACTVACTAAFRNKQQPVAWHLETNCLTQLVMGWECHDKKDVSCLWERTVMCGGQGADSAGMVGRHMKKGRHAAGWCGAPCVQTVGVAHDIGPCSREA
jgi:hypothetical protein